MSDGDTRQRAVHVIVEDSNISRIPVRFHEIIDAAVDDVLIKIDFVCAGVIDCPRCQMDAVKEVADSIASKHETSSVEFRIDIDRATFEATAYTAVAFHVIEGPFEDVIHEQAILDRQSVRIQLGVDLRIIVTERAVLNQDIRRIQHINRAGGFVSTVMIQFQSIDLHVVAGIEDDTAIKTAHMNNVAIQWFLK